MLSAARSAGLRHLDAGECAEQRGDRSDRRHGDGGQSTVHLQPAGAVAGSAASMSVVMTDPAQIAAAGVGQGSGDNSNAGRDCGAGESADRQRADAHQLLFRLRNDTGFDGFAGADGEYGAERFGYAAADARDALSSVNLNDEASSMQQFETQLPGGVAGIHNSEHNHDFGFESGRGDGGLVMPAEGVTGLNSILSSGAQAPFIIQGLMHGLKPCPFKATRFPAGYKALCCELRHD